ncbi:MAG: hypothetical protein HXX10_23645 [Rhodoplanes sp.]|uniref:hypothetical protein n=1 Tax=Rhodoplanes sp. TaxID=1968906 RepID=UPI0017C5ECAA|nr:hypothetical protein [Rhodoplanes sp.]NVO17030.1 hypothetical protein [Rhodoplanes sp.]
MATPSGETTRQPTPRPEEITPEARMERRWPQPVQVGALIGLPVLDDDDRTLGVVRRVMRTPADKIVLIVDHHAWYGLGWLGLGVRPVSVPIEVVAIFGRQLASLDMPPADYAAAPTWAQRQETDIPAGETIRIALTRR